MSNSLDFPYSAKEFRIRAAAYKQQTNRGEIQRPDLSHFCGLNDLTVNDLVDYVKGCEDTKSSIVYEIKKFLTWMQGQYATHPAWSGPNQSKAIFLLKQDFGAFQFTDKQQTDSNRDININVSFGGRTDAFD